jgi:hypothetical protein
LLRRLGGGRGAGAERREHRVDELVWRRLSHPRALAGGAAAGAVKRESPPAGEGERAAFVSAGYREMAYWQMKVDALQVDLANFLLTPPHEQHWPATLLALIFVHAAAQLPLLVLASSFRP